MNQTDLTLEMLDKGTAIAPFSARECIQTLSPISQGVLRRTINGALVCVGNGGHRKFYSSISCKDKAPPAFEKVWEGMPLKVGCIQYLTLAIPPQSQRVQLQREARSLQLYESSGKEWSIERMEDRWAYLPLNFPGGFLTYQPILLMAVKNYTLETDEWGLTVGWKLELEEI